MNIMKFNPGRSGLNPGRRASAVTALLSIAILTSVLSCDSPTESKNKKDTPTEPKTEKSLIFGFIQDATTGLAIGHPAWVLKGDKLLATTNSTGAFEIQSLDAGTYTFTGAALDHRDTSFTVQVAKGDTVQVDFRLAPDNIEKRVIGEFQNAVMFRDSLSVRPEMAGWTGKQIYDELTGATIQGKPPMDDFNEHQVFIGDSLVSTADNWGQYSFRLKANTVPLRGVCPGYRDTVIVATLSPAGRIIVNFFMEPEG
jgi:hypothetical protein